MPNPNWALDSDPLRYDVRCMHPVGCMAFLCSPLQGSIHLVRCSLGVSRDHHAHSLCANWWWRTTRLYPMRTVAYHSRSCALAHVKHVGLSGEALYVLVVGTVVSAVSGRVQCSVARSGRAEAVGIRIRPCARGCIDMGSGYCQGEFVTHFPNPPGESALNIEFCHILGSLVSLV